MADIPIVLLAAGSSSRMGQAKQLLAWGKQTLIEFQLEKLLQTGNPVIVVLGSSAEQIIPVVKKYSVSIVINENWESGMGTSVAAGASKVLSDFPDANSVLYTLIDQPLITVAHLQNLVGKFSPGQQQIIASQSKKGWLGVPALYDAFYFRELSELTGEQGAKTLIKKYSRNVISLDAGELLEDMDTIDKYHQLFARFSTADQNK